MPDILWPSEDKSGIPSLLPSMQANGANLPVVIWGSTSRTKRMSGTWCFYTDDYRFDALWKHPNQLLETGCLNAVEPNFSVFDQTPQAVAMWQIYRKRWLARYWQSQGVRIFVDLNVSRVFAEDNLVGVPKGWKAFATRGCDERMADLAYEHGLAKTVSSNAPDLCMVVYGGGDKTRDYCMDHGLVYIQGYLSKAKKPKPVNVQLGFI